MNQNHFESLYPADSRLEEVSQIVSYIREGTSCQLVGLPGSGRGNILALMAFNREIRKKHFGEYQVWIHFVSMNFSEVRARDVKDVMKYLFLSLADSVRDRNMDEAYSHVTQLFRESLVLNDEFVLFQGLKNAIEYLALEKKLTIVFLFDRFDEYLPGLTSEFFANLRVLRDRAKFRFSVVFSVNRPLEENVEEGLIADFYDYIAGHHVYVSFYDKASSMFRLSYLQKVTGRTLPEAVVDEVFRLTSMHERLLRMSFEAIFLPASPYAHVTESSLIKEPELTHLATYLLQQKPIQKALKHIEQVLIPQEQRVLCTKHFMKDLPIDSLHYLEHVGLIKHEDIEPPLLALYLGEKRKTATHTYPFVFNRATNTIRRGEEIISEQLTAAEFRLLSYLMQHAEQTIERDEIINRVWAGSKTTLGVTDQALDQLVFRVRKKIETDPNTPEHLLTVKGRGFKFII
ncbi:hypothetical protein BH11PAT1_BH11PAT1_0710 [soil metagenome]